MFFAMTVLACDLGGTLTKLGIVRGGRVLAQGIVPSNSKLGLAPLLPVLKAEWLRLGSISDGTPIPPGARSGWKHPLLGSTPPWSPPRGC
jgi:hypothetical protein